MVTKTLVIGSALALSMMFTVPAWSGNGQGIGNEQGIGNGQGIGNERQPKGDSADCVSGLPYEDVSEAEIAGLRHMREEEKLARDIYMAFNELWGHWTFANIMRSEQRHMEQVGQLLVKYQIADPITDDTPGVFSDEALKSLYDTLLESGKVSLIEALRVGATIEDLDIFDLKRELTLADNEDIRTVYQNLMKGSRNHLRAFVYQLSLLGEVYVPNYLTLEELQAIIAAEPERGPLDENGAPIDAGDRTGSTRRNGMNIENGDADYVVGDDLLSQG